MPNTTNKRIQRKGIYVDLKDIQCECGHPATRQVLVTQLRGSGNEVSNVLPLCDNCYKLMVEEEQAYCQRVGRQTALVGVT